MKLQKAIENLQADLLRPDSVNKLDFQDAEQLGIEAMKRLIACREPEGGSPLPPLEGETED